jgi:uncharacterized coiled-coil DUF342 family protein
MDDGLSLIISGSAVGAIATLVGSWIKARYSKTKIEPQPLEIKQTPNFVTCDECKAHRKAVHSRIDELRPRIDKLIEMMQKSDAKAEERALHLHRRIDPLSEKLAATNELLKNHLYNHRNKND